MSEKLLEEIYDKHHEDAFLWARQCAGYSEDTAKDVMQNVYMKILTGKARFSQKAKLKTWLFSVIKYTTIDLVRKTRKADSLDGYEMHGESPDLGHLDHQYYQEILQRLSKKQREVLLLVFYHDHTLEEAAEVLELSIGTVRTHYDRGKKKLKKILEKENDERYDYIR